jgi:hypothetical protein
MIVIIQEWNYVYRVASHYQRALPSAMNQALAKRAKVRRNFSTLGAATAMQ